MYSRQQRKSSESYQFIFRSKPVPGAHMNRNSFRMGGFRPAGIKKRFVPWVCPARIKQHFIPWFCSARIKRRLVPWMFLAPSLAGVICFTGIPFFDVMKRSFQDAMGKRFVGLDNYRAVLENQPFRLAAGNTVHFLTVCIPLLMLVSFAMALLLSAGSEEHGESGERGRNRKDKESGERRGSGKDGGSRGKRRKNQYVLFRTTLVLPMAIPAASMVLVWKIFLCPQGLLNQILTRITGEMFTVDWAFSSWAFPVLTVTYLWKHAGYDMILWLAGLQAIPYELYEAAKIDGAGAVARLWYITIPELQGTFAMVGILSLVNSFRVYREAYLLAGSYPDASIYLLPHLFAHWFLQLDIQKMTAAAMMMTVSFFVLALLGRGAICVFNLLRKFPSSFL